MVAFLVRMGSDVASDFDAQFIFHNPPPRIWMNCGGSDGGGVLHVYSVRASLTRGACRQTRERTASVEGRGAALSLDEAAGRLLARPGSVRWVESICFLVHSIVSTNLTKCIILFVQG